MRRTLRSATAALLLLLPSEAYLARHADYAKTRITIEGTAARELAALLGMPTDRTNSLELALPETMEHFVRMAAGGGDTSVGRADRRSRRLSNIARWDAPRATLEIGEHWFDRRTALPHAEGPAYFFPSPELDESAPDEARGWEALTQALRKGQPEKDLKKPLHERRFIVRADLHVRVALWRPTWPGGRQLVLIEVGPPVGASSSTVGF
jgi:hypothetical protein